MNKIENNSLGCKIRLARIKKDISQGNFAKLLNVHYISVSRWENNHEIPNIETLKKIAKVLEKSVSYFLGESSEVDLTSIKPLTPDNVINLPLLASIPAGLPEYSEKDIESFTQIPRYLFPGADFIIHCCGDSMEPEIHKDDYCVIRKETEPINNKVMLVKTETGFTIKRIIKKGSKVELHPQNGNHKVIIPKELKVIGLVIGYWHRMD